MSYIWKDKPDIEAVRRVMENTASSNLGIELVEIGDDFLVGTMPADHRTFQPMGTIHGGANVLLAETLGSIAATLCIDSSVEACVGQEVNANHLRSVKEGLVTGTARVIHRGRTSHVWEIRIVDDNDKLSCISRLTIAVISINKS